MIKPIVVAVCDICGCTQKAKPSTWRNETEYGLPDGWSVASGNTNVHLCPACTKKLGVVHYGKE